MSETTPRITAPYLENFAHQIVRILGRVTQLRGDNATVDAGGQISIHLSRVILIFLFHTLSSSFDSHFTMNHAVEIVGKVQADLSIKLLASTDFGTNIDFSAVEAVVDATHRHKEIFYNADE